MEIPQLDSIGVSTAVKTPTPTNTKDAPPREIVTAVNEINKSELMGEGRQLSFTRDPDTHRPVIQIIDQSTGEVVDQIPSETVLELAQQLK
jgi:flagellar protein FlaG